MRFRFTIFLLALGMLFVHAKDTHLPEQQSALIIEGESPDVANSFRSIVINNEDIHFDVYRYPSLLDVGSGNGIQFDLFNLENYDYILISVHQGTLADDLMARLAKYVKGGGRLYLLYQSHPKPYFIESMEFSTNTMLSLLDIDDEVRYENAFFENNVRGSLMEVSNSERLENSSRSGVNKLKKEQNHSVTPYKATMGSGHFFYKNSDLDNADLIYEFNSLNVQHPVCAFWKSGSGVFGIGTEKYTSSVPQRDIYASWKAIWEGLNIVKNVTISEVEEVAINEYSDQILSDRKIEQLRKQEKLIKEKIELDLSEEKERNEAAFKRYTDKEHQRLALIKEKEEKDQMRLKMELEKQVAAKIKQEEEAQKKKKYTRPNQNKKVNVYKDSDLADSKNSIGSFERPSEVDWLEGKVKHKEALDVLSAQVAPSQFLIRNLTNVTDGMRSDRLASVVENLSKSKSDILLIESHLNYEEGNISNTLRSVRVAEKMKQYFVRKGIAANRIMIMGVGDSYNMDDQVILHQCDPSGLYDGNYNRTKTDLISSTSYDLFANKSSKLKFKIMLGSNPSSWASDVIKKHGYFSLEQFGGRRTIFGMVGLFDNAATAKDAASKILTNQLTGPKVVAYFDGIRLTNEQVELLTPFYPELKSMVSL